MSKIYSIFFVISILVLSNLHLYAQGVINEEESIIEMTPAELQIIVEELMQARKKRLTYLALQKGNTTTGSNNIQEALENQNLRQQVDEMEKTLNSINERLSQSTNTPKTTIDHQDLDFLKKQLIGEIQSLKKVFYDFTLKSTPSTTPSSSLNDKQLLVFAGQMMQLRSTLDSLFFSMNNLVEKEQFEQLGQQLDSLQKKIQQPIYANPMMDERMTEQWNNQFKELRILLEKTQTNATESDDSDGNYVLMKEIINGREEEKLYFKTNSFSLDEPSKTKIQQATQLIIQYEQLDILLIGYADKKGSAYYNQELSQKRAETAKKFIMSQGIHPTRIFTQSQGVDYTAESSPAARRVDLVLLIKR